MSQDSLEASHVFWDSVTDDRQSSSGIWEVNLITSWSSLSKLCTVHYINVICSSTYSEFLTVDTRVSAFAFWNKQVLHEFEWQINRNWTHCTEFTEASSCTTFFQFSTANVSLTGSRKSSSPVRRRRLASYSSETSLHRSRFQRMSRRHNVFMLVTIAVIFSLSTMT